MQCQIISIGNELLIGDTINTNASWLGQVFTDAGLEVTHIHTIADDLKVMKTTLQHALNNAQLVVTTGGLGPTHDDITKQAVTELFDCELILHKPVLASIKKMFNQRGIPFSKSNYHQAEVPDCCEVLFNDRGTAPGMWFDREQASLAVLPGVPHEMKNLVQKKVLPKINEIDAEKEFRISHYLTTAGIGESTLSDDLIGDLSDVVDDHISVAYLPNPEGTKIRISARGSSEQKVREDILPVADLMKRRGGYNIIGEGKGVTIAEVVGKVLKEQNLMLATAESCTGGLVSDMITDIPGSSRYMKGGIIAYSNAIKADLLGVDDDILQQFGAVSKQTALQMAQGAAQKLDADIGISTTGIAGPDGGTKKKPVGTVWVGFWSNKQHFALGTHLTKDRLLNKKRTAAVALDTIRRCVLNISEMPYGLQKQQA